MALLKVANLQEPVVVDDEVIDRLPDVEWLAIGGRIISLSRPGWQAILDLATEIGGPGARPEAGTSLDYRRSSLGPGS